MLAVREAMDKAVQQAAHAQHGIGVVGDLALSCGSTTRGRRCSHNGLGRLFPRLVADSSALIRDAREDHLCPDRVHRWLWDSREPYGRHDLSFTRLAAWNWRMLCRQ